MWHIRFLIMTKLNFYINVLLSMLLITQLANSLFLCMLNENVSQKTLAVLLTNILYSGSLSQLRADVCKYRPEVGKIKFLKNPTKIM